MIITQPLIPSVRPTILQEVMEGGMLVEQLFFHDPDNNMIEVRRLLDAMGPRQWHLRANGILPGRHMAGHELQLLRVLSCRPGVQARGFNRAGRLPASAPCPLAFTHLHPPSSPGLQL